LAQAQERLALLYYQLGHSRQSQTLIASLLENPWLRSNPYRLAQVLCIQGEIALAAGRTEEAELALASSLKTFESLEAWDAIGGVAFLQGQHDSQTGHFTVALHHFSEALDALGRINDNVRRTDIAVELEALAEQKKLSEADSAHINHILSDVPTRYFVERFPGEISRRFWWPNLIAGLGVWGIAFIVVVLITLIVGGVITDIQSEKLGWNLSSLIVMLLTPVFILWGFQLIYTLVGAAFYAWRIPLASIEQAQPNIYISTTASLTCRRSSSDQPESEIEWKAHPYFVSNITSLRDIPIALLSKLTLISRQNQIVIGGTVNHLRSLKRLIRSQVAPTRGRNYDTVLLNRAWTSILLVLCVILGIVLATQTTLTFSNNLSDEIYIFGICIAKGTTGCGPLQGAGKGEEVPAAHIFLGINLALLLVFPLVSILRVVIQFVRARVAVLTISRKAGSD
jgi:tetratricopeptide (TPR) repeat protein